MTDDQIEIAGQTDTIFVDGTFSICPHPFFQVFIVSAKVGQNVFPMATALMPNKLQSSYRDLFEKIKIICEEKGEIDFVHIHSDCEQGILNATKEVFPNAENHLCRFHVVDVQRKNANTFGLRPIINQNSEFKNFYASQRQIYFFPPDYWPRLWQIFLSKLSTETKNLPPVQRFLAYLVRYTSKSQFKFSLFF